MCSVVCSLLVAAPANALEIVGCLLGNPQPSFISINSTSFPEAHLRSQLARAKSLEPSETREAAINGLTVALDLKDFKPGFSDPDDSDLIERLSESDFRSYIETLDRGTRHPGLVTHIDYLSAQLVSTHNQRLSPASDSSTLATQRERSPQTAHNNSTSIASGSASPNTAADVFSVVDTAFRKMTRTHYRHHYTQDIETGVYLSDCVGLADYLLYHSAPQAWKHMHTQLRIARGWVPTPTMWGDYLRELPNGATSVWAPVKQAKDIQPGDFILMDKVSETGHAMIAAGIPQPLSEGRYVLRIYDSTSSPHGSDDSRRTDSRAKKISPENSSGSGFGLGTIEIRTDQTDHPTKITWSVGSKPINKNIVIARAIA